MLTFGIAAIVGVAAAAVAEDLRYFAEGSPDSFLQTWRIQPVSMFVGSLVFVTTLYLLQRLNDRQHALNYVFPYVPLVVFSGIDLAARLNPLWVAFVAAAPASAGASCKSISCRAAEPAVFGFPRLIQHGCPVLACFWLGRGLSLPNVTDCLRIFQ